MKRSGRAGGPIEVAPQGPSVSRARDPDPLSDARSTRARRHPPDERRWTGRSRSQRIGQWTATRATWSCRPLAKPRAPSTLDVQRLELVWLPSLDCAPVRGSGAATLASFGRATTHSREPSRLPSPDLGEDTGAAACTSDRPCPWKSRDRFGALHGIATFLNHLHVPSSEHSPRGHSTSMRANGPSSAVGRAALPRRSRRTQNRSVVAPRIIPAAGSIQCRPRSSMAHSRGVRPLADQKQSSRRFQNPMTRETANPIPGLGRFGV